tara:strand:- start:6011 stop:6415 length:405 start_codon:yes stop_codon:yes gene_type:complete
MSNAATAAPVATGAFRNGFSGLPAGRMLPYFTVPMIVGVLGLAYGIREVMKTPQRRRAEATSGCKSKYCPPSAYQIWVDTPKNTQLTDQSQGTGLGTAKPTSMARVWQEVDREYFQEVATSPGVGLVAESGVAK